VNRFTIPRDIYYGDDSLEILKKLNGRKAIVVTGGSSMKRFGFLDKVAGYLKEAGMEVDYFDGVEPDPSVDTVMKGAQTMRELNPDWIISIGGGSAIDAAKAMWIFYEHPDLSFYDVKEPFTVPELRKKARFVAIPSTSGTATEVTAFSVITDYSEKIKYPLADFNITPDIAIVDPALANTMPEKLAAHTGMDALTHAVEAYVATLHSPFTDPLALKAIEMIRDNLVKSYKGDREARKQMHIAQCLAGMAFTNALLGIVHSMAHKTGAIFHIPHGLANAMFLPYVIQYNTKTSIDRYAAISKALGLPGKTDEELTDSFIELIKQMNREMNIPQTLKDYGITEEDFKQNLEYISENAVEDPCTGSNPRETSVEDMKRLFTSVYKGEAVNY